MPSPLPPGDNGGVQIADSSLVLDREQLRCITMDDPVLMREILEALIQDTSKQLRLLEVAIRQGDGADCARLAHYSKGACANVGANRAAALLHEIERNANTGRLQECGRAVETLCSELALLREERV